MAVQIRPARADEMDQYGAIAAYVYAGRYGTTSDNFVTQSTDPDWTLCAFVDGRMATSFATIPFTTRLNGEAGKLGGVSGVGTLPEYRRQGFLRRIMQHAIADMRDRGQFISSLWASQAAIYQRYGYAHATHNLAYSIDPQDIRFVSPPPSQGTCQRYSLEDGFPVLRQLYIDFIASRMLYLHRVRALWHNNILNANDADGPVHVVVYHDDRDVPQGYMVYTTRFGRVDHAARAQDMTVRHLVWLTPETYLGLWAFITKHDLVGRVHFPHMPPDDPAAIFLQEPRLLHARATEGTWLRITQATGALAARHYAAAGHLTIEITGDDLADWNNGVVELETDGTESQVKVTSNTATPDICLGPRGLAMLYSGTHPARQLSNWGLLRGSPQAIGTADRLFQTQYAPHCPDHF